jgi:hypothetical protein
MNARVALSPSAALPAISRARRSRRYIEDEPLTIGSADQMPVLALIPGDRLTTPSAMQTAISRE